MSEPAEKTYVIRFTDGNVSRIKAHEITTKEKHYKFLRDGEVVAQYRLDSVIGWQIEEDNPR